MQKVKKMGGNWVLRASLRKKKQHHTLS